MLTNKQYDDIYKIYDEIQYRNRQILMDRKKEVKDSIPEYQTLTDNLVSLTSSFARDISELPGTGLRDYQTALKDLAQKKKQLLISYGFSSDYLDPIYECQDCKDTGYIDGNKCRCFKQRIVNFAYDQSHIRSHLEKNNFATLSTAYYEGADLVAFNNILAKIKEYINSFDNTFNNLLFMGNVGVGKTFLSECIAKELLDSGHTVLYLSAEKLMEIFSNKIKNVTADESSSNSDDLMSCDLLIIDDLGTEMINSFTISNLFSLLNERILREKSVVISTNLSMNDFRDLYSERIASRIVSNYELLKITGPDIRIMKKMC